MFSILCGLMISISDLHVCSPWHETYENNIFPASTCFFFRFLQCCTASYLSRKMTKPTKWLCAQRRLRSAWASAQSDQSLRWPHEESLAPKLPIERTAKTLIRLGGCPGWSESLLGAHSFYWFCHVVAHLCHCSYLSKLIIYFLNSKTFTFFFWIYKHF